MCGGWSLLFLGMMAAARVGCRSSCTRSKSRLTRGTLPEQNRIASIKYIVWTLSRTYTALSGVPRNNSIGKQLPRVVFSLVFEEVGEVWEFSGFFPVVSVMYCTSICSSRFPVFQVHACLLKGDQVTLSSWLGSTEFHVHRYLISWNFTTFLSTRSMIDAPQGPHVHQHGTLDRLGSSESWCFPT